MDCEQQVSGSNHVRAWARFAYGCFRGRPCEAPKSAAPSATLVELGLGPLMGYAAAASGRPELLPFEQLRVDTRAVNVWRLDVLREVSGQWQKAGLRHVIHKGAAAVVRFPEYLDLRPMADLDVLVGGEDFSSAIRILESSGWAAIDKGLPVSQLWTSERSFRRVDRSVPVTIDLHRRLHHWPLARALTQATLEGAETIGGLRVPSLHHALLVTSLHRAKHGFTADCRELLDFRLVADLFGESQWRLLPEVAESAEIEGGLYITWKLARLWFGGGSDTESVQFERLRSKLGPLRRRALDRLADLDSPTLADKPWARLPFLGLYVTMPVVTGRVLPAIAAVPIHITLRLADVALGKVGLHRPPKIS